MDAEACSADYHLVMGHPSFDDVVRFHGHRCPGLAIGYRMALAALDFLHAERAEDEELVAVIENDACGVDALQVAAGCTFGKGNLVFLDLGKPVYTLFARKARIGVRVAYHGRGLPEEARRDRDRYVEAILTAPPGSLFELRQVDGLAPAKASLHESVVCSLCGEPVMATRTRTVGKAVVCIPCSEMAPHTNRPPCERAPCPTEARRSSESAGTRPRGKETTE